MMKAVYIWPRSVFVGRKYVQHAVREKRSGRCIRYHSNLNPGNRDLSDAIAFAYERGIVLVAEQHSLPAEKVLDQHVGDSGKQTRFIQGSRRLLESRTKASGLSMFMLKARSLSEDQ